MREAIEFHIEGLQNEGSVQRIASTPLLTFGKNVIVSAS